LALSVGKSCRFTYQNPVKLWEKYLMKIIEPVLAVLPFVIYR